MSDCNRTAGTSDLLPMGSAEAAIPTSFSHAIETEPLARFCIKVLEIRDKHHNVVPGSGLKVLRLISKQLYSVMTLNNIRGYTLLLDGIKEDVPGVRLLKLTKLSRLHVVVVADSLTARLGLSHMRQLRSFIAEAEASLVTISDMHVTLLKRAEGYEHYEQDVASVLDPIAAACPRVQQLKVTGDIGQPLLTTFGRSWECLTRLETEDVPAATLEKMIQLLPQVRSTDMKLVRDDRPQMWDEIPEDFILAISSCTTLTSLYMGVESLDQSVWEVLPPSIQYLHAGEYCFSNGSQPQRTPASLQQLLPNLREAVSVNEHIPLCAVATLLRAAPGLKILAIGAVSAPRNLSQIPDLVFVNECLRTGSFNVENASSRYEWNVNGMVLTLQDNGNMTPTALFVLPVLEQFKSIELQTVEQELLTNLANAFPRIHTLLLSHEVRARDLQRLTSFPLLEQVDFGSRENRFTDFDLGALLTQNPLLWHVRLQASGVDCIAVQSAMRTWGRVVRVQIYRGF